MPRTVSERGDSSNTNHGETGSEVLVLSEIFPPTIGGSGELLRNVYERFDTVPVTVLSDSLSQEAPRASPTHLTVVRESMRTPEWGLLHPAGLRHHLRQVARLRRVTRRRAMVVHCARALPEGVGAWIQRGLGGVPYVCWAHGEDIASAQSSRELTWLMARVLRSAGALIANSRNTARMLGAAGAPEDRIVVVHPGVDAARFRPAVSGSVELRERLTAGEPAGLLLTVGRLQRRKGHDVMLQALARIDRRATPVRYVIVGDGEERERLERLSSELGLSGCVQFAGAVAAGDLPAYYAAADVFVHPNRVDAGDIEGFGIVFLEAAAAGLPVVAGDSGGVSEAVVRDVTGVLVSGTDIGELYDAVTGLLASPERRRTMGEAGRARVAREFSWDRAAARVRAIHAQVANWPIGQ